jgi:hypothetical protein
MLLVVTASVAYLALRPGRLCPHCGGVTNPVVLRRLLRLLSPWLQWRWCSRCGWEGPGRRGPDLGPLDPPVDRGSGFRWGGQDSEDVPIFYWRSDGPGGKSKDRPDHQSGFKWQSARGPNQPSKRDPPGFDFGPPEDMKPPKPQWEPGRKRRHPSRGDQRHQIPRPWYLTWLVSRDAPGFRWKQRED